MTRDLGFSGILLFVLGLALMVELAPGIRPLEVFGPYVMEFLRGGEEPEAATKNDTKGLNRSIPDASKSV